MDPDVRTWMPAVAPGGCIHNETFVRTVDDAVLTPFAVQQTADGRGRRSYGAVYVGGELIRESLRSGGRGGDIVEPADPEVLEEIDGPPEVLAGRWLYGGHWMGQFGHFVTETLTSLWPCLDAPYDGIVFHRFIFEQAEHSWQRNLLQLSGFGRIPLRVVGHRPLRVENLTVPTRAFIPNWVAGRMAVRIWDVIEREARVGPPVYLSRSRLGDDPRAVPGDAAVDREMADRGFRIIHPQELPVREQLSAVATAPILSAMSGSALHLSAFAPSRALVLELGDRRTHRSPLANQLAIDAAKGRQSAYVPFYRGQSGRDVPRTMRAVDALLTC